MSSASNGGQKAAAPKPTDILPPSITNYGAPSTEVLPKPDANEKSTAEVNAPQVSPPEDKEATEVATSTAPAPVTPPPNTVSVTVSSTPPAPPNTPSKPPLDPFADLSKLTLSQDFAAAIGVKKIITTVPVRKPNRFEFVRVHPDDAYTLITGALCFKEDREEIYLVDRAFWMDLGPEVRPIALYTTVNRQNVPSLWPVKLPGPDGRHDTWNASALQAVAHAKTSWVRVAANMSLGGYDVVAATAELSDPQWPDLSFTEILRIAFRDRFIDDPDHVVLKKLRGEL